MNEDFEVSIGEQVKCPFCHSKKTEILETFREQICRHLDKPKKNSTGMVRVISYGNDSKDYFIRKIVCLDCGQVSKSLPEEILQQYNKDKQYFKGY